MSATVDTPRPPDLGDLIEKGVRQLRRNDVVTFVLVGFHPYRRRELRQAIEAEGRRQGVELYVRYRAGRKPQLEAFVLGELADAFGVPR